MITTYKGKFGLFGLLTFLIILVGCGAPSFANSTPSAQTQLNQSAAAMSKLTSVHIAFQSTLTASSSSSSLLSFSVSGEGDAATPDKVSMQITAGTQPAISVIAVGSKVYFQENGTWYFVDKSKVTNPSQQFFSQSLAARIAQIEILLQDATLVDHGQVSMDGTMLEHITATLNATTLQQLTTQLNGILPSGLQSSQNTLKAGTLDLWIDPSTHYVHQATLDTTGTVDTSKYTNVSNAQQIAFEAKATINFSKFNESVSITAPGNAVPLPTP